MDAAAKQKHIFHLWFHPTNLADDMEQMVAGLRMILEYAAELQGIAPLLPRRGN